MEEFQDDFCQKDPTKEQGKKNLISSLFTDEADSDSESDKKYESYTQAQLESAV